MVDVCLLGLDLAAFDKKTNNSKTVAFHGIELYFAMK